MLPAANRTQRSGDFDTTQEKILVDCESAGGMVRDSILASRWGGRGRVHGSRKIHNLREKANIASPFCSLNSSGAMGAYHDVLLLAPQ